MDLSHRDEVWFCTINLRLHFEFHGPRSQGLGLVWFGLVWFGFVFGIWTCTPNFMNLGHWESTSMGGWLGCAGYVVGLRRLCGWVAQAICGGWWENLELRQPKGPLDLTLRFGNILG